MLTASSVKTLAREAGFDLCGIATAERHPRLARIAAWIDRGCAGDMQYLADSLDERLDPRNVLPTARSVVSLGTVYNTGAPRAAGGAGADPDRVAIARYAWGDDYHDVLRARLRRLLQAMADAAGPGFEAFSCVDNGPVQERVFAEQAGLGWIGKNACVINPQLGSWIFLAAILTSADLDADAPAVDQCGTCTRCLDACPTGAITGPGDVDATRCLSYLTIERRGAVPEPMREAMHPQVFGCDICQDVCPWNRRAAASADPAWQPRAGLSEASLLDLCRLSDEAWRALLRGSAMRRAGLRGIRRSLAYAAAHLPGTARDRALDALADQVSAADSVVRDAILWARGHEVGNMPRPRKEA